MKIQHHIDLLHRLEHRVVYLIRLDPAIRVGRHTPRIRFNTWSASVPSLSSYCAYIPAIPAFLALRTSSGVSSGDKYSVIMYSVCGSIASSCCLYASACSVVVMGGLVFGWARRIR